MSEIKLTDYLPDVDEISAETLQEVRSRILLHLESKFSNSIDTSPNSVVGDLVLSPLSYLIASFEIAANRIFSDLDLANVSQGTIYNCDFVQRYLENFGLSQRTSTNSSGVVQLTFSQALDYTLDAGTVFAFTVNGEELFFEMSEVSDQLDIKTSLEPGQESTTLKQLIKINDSEFVVNIPVSGPAGATVTKNQIATSNLGIAQLTSIIAVNDFDAGTLPENVMELASKSRNTYYAASLGSRNGTLSFLLQTYPELTGVSPVVSGDAEMIRGGDNMFGVKHGVMDVFIKSKKNLIELSSVQSLAYDSVADLWVGSIDKLSGPPMNQKNIVFPELDNGVFEYDIISKPSNETDYPQLSHTYSVNETLGVAAQFSGDSLEIGDQPTIEFEPTINIALGGLSVAGNYNGSVFKKALTRTITVTFNEYDTVNYETLTVTLSDGVDSLAIELRRDPANDDSDPSILYAFTKTQEYNQFLSGIDISFSLNTTTASALSQLKLLLDGSYSEVVRLKPRTLNYTIDYGYDALVNSISELTEGNDVKPINCDIQARSFIPCVVDNITIVYRAKSGTIVDVESAKSDIINYVNSLTYPNLYESYAIAEIVMYHGASGVKDVSQSGNFYPSFASYILNSQTTFNQDNLQNSILKKLKDTYGYTFDPVAVKDPSKPGVDPIPKIPTTSLLPTSDRLGIGDRNIQYILDSSNIIFDEVSF